MYDEYSGPGPQPYDPQAKLVLPAHHEDVIPPSENAPTTAMPASRANIGPEQLIRYAPNSIPTRPVAKFAYLLRHDPAYQVLCVAIALILVVGIVLTAFASSIFGSGSTPTKPGPNTGGAAVAVSPVATRHAHPTPTPIPTPSPTPIPTPSPTPISKPTAPPTQSAVGAFTLTIVSVPQVVNNDSTVQVVVKSSLSQAQASLLVTYDASPGVYFGKTVTTGGDGNATLNWKIRVNMFNNHTNATVRVVGQSQSGQQTQSAPVNVTVVGGNM